jgi:hypothetical protein
VLPCALLGEESAHGDGRAAVSASATAPAALLAVSSAGGHVDIFGWPCPLEQGQSQPIGTGDIPPDTCEQAVRPSPSSGDDTHPLEASLAAWYAQAPLWLQALPTPPVPPRAQRGDRSNLWTPVCWVPPAGGGLERLEGTLLAGTLAGDMLAWTLRLQQDVWRDRVAQHAQRGIAGTSTAPVPRSPAPGGAWRRKAAGSVLVAEQKQICSKAGHSRMLFAIHVVTEAAPIVQAESESSCEETGPQAPGILPANSSRAAQTGPLRVITVSLDRKVVCWCSAARDVPAGGLSAGASAHDVATLRVERSWHGTGAPVTALCVRQVRLIELDSCLSAGDVAPPAMQPPPVVC